MSQDAIVQELVDHREIVDLVNRLCLVYDDKRIDDMPDICTADVAADYPGSPTVTGRDELIAFGNDARQAFERARHLVTNVLVEIDGDLATVSANMFAIGVYPGGDASSYAELGGIWNMEVIRQAVGWRISRIRFEQIWMTNIPRSEQFDSATAR